MLQSITEYNKDLHKLELQYNAYSTIKTLILRRLNIKVHY